MDAYDNGCEGIDNTLKLKTKNLLDLTEVLAALFSYF